MNETFEAYMQERAVTAHLVGLYCGKDANEVTGAEVRSLRDALNRSLNGLTADSLSVHGASSEGAESDADPGADSDGHHPNGHPVDHPNDDPWRRPLAGNIEVRNPPEESRGLARDSGTFANGSGEHQANPSVNPSVKGSAMGGERVPLSRRRHAVSHAVTAPSTNWGLVALYVLLVLSMARLYWGNLS
jgi:hypothetical protein